MSAYPTYLDEVDYYEEMIGSEIIEPPECQDISEARYYAGLNKPRVKHVAEPNEPRDFGDNNPSDPFNIDLE